MDVYSLSLSPSRPLFQLFTDLSMAVDAEELKNINPELALDVFQRVYDNITAWDIQNRVSTLSADPYVYIIILIISSVYTYTHTHTHTHTHIYIYICI
ncbi:hypothetical protein KIPB_016288, partial [Kipferlia bialata]|eukprot:g16288.t1